MLFFMGASACGLMREALMQQRYQAAQTAARRALRVPMGRVRPGAEPLWEAEEQPEYEDFPCFHLCLTCGYLAESDQELCPGCGHRNWTDLRSIASAEAIRQMERRDRRVIPEDILWKSHVTAGSLGGTAGVVAFLSAASAGVAVIPAFLLGTIAFGAVTVPGAYFVSRLWNSVHFRRRPSFPIRWHVPMPQHRGEPRDTVTGPAVPHSELIAAPVSGRRCIGYELTALFDAPGDLRPPMWVLEEERTIPFEIEGRRVAANRATLKLPSREAAREDGAVDSSRLVRLLRQRGLFASEGDFIFFEAIIEPEANYQLELHDNAVTVVRKA